MASQPIRILVVDDIDRTREYVVRILSFEDDIDVVGSAADGEEAIEQTRLLQPDLVLLDLMMPRLGGLDAAPLILEAHPAARIIVMSVQGERDYLRRAMLAGAYEFLVKPFSSDDLTTSIRSVVDRPPLPRPDATPSSTRATAAKRSTVPPRKPQGQSSLIGLETPRPSEPWRRRQDELRYHYFPIVERAGGPMPSLQSICGLERAGHDKTPPRTAVPGMVESAKGVRYCERCSAALEWLRDEGGGEIALTDRELPITVPKTWLDAHEAAETAPMAPTLARQEARAAEERERRRGLDWSFAAGLDIAYGRSVVADAAWIVLPRAWLQELVALRRLEGRTWAWAAERLSRPRLEDLFERRVLDDLEADGPAPLTIDDVPADYRFGDLGFDDDWPETPDRLLDRWAREHEALGDYVSEWGDFWGATYGSVAGDLLGEFLADLRAAGATCRKDERLVRAAYSG